MRKHNEGVLCNVALDPLAHSNLLTRWFSRGGCATAAAAAAKGESAGWEVGGALQVLLVGGAADVAGPRSEPRSEALPADGMASLLGNDIDGAAAAAA